GREEVTPDMLEKEREIYRAQALASGKPEPVVEKIVSGKMEKFYEENCLYEQHYIKDESVTIGEMISQAVANLGENISIRRFVRFKVGEVSGGAATGAASAARPGGDEKPPAPRTNKKNPHKGAAGAFFSFFLAVSLSFCSLR